MSKLLGYESINTHEAAQEAATQMAKGNYPPGLDHCFVAGVNGVFDDPDGICNFYMKDPADCVCPDDVKAEFVEILQKRDRDAAIQKAEELMGEAVIARHRQANYQWEKTESFIQSYQEQKRSNPHGLTCLQPPKADKPESGDNPR